MIVLMFALIVLIHELGHFLAARFFKVRVNEFAIGMGPKLFGIQRGDTLYSIRALPLGGFCAIEGEGGDSYEEDSMMNKKPWQKFIIFIAGAVMNFLLAWVIFATIIGYAGTASNTVSFIEPNSPVHQAGIQVGETIVSINGTPTKNFAEIKEQLGIAKDAHTFQVVDANKQVRTLNIEPKEVESGRYMYGFRPGKAPATFTEIVWGGLRDSVMVVVQIAQTFVMLITGEVPVQDLAGIVGVVQISSEMWNEGMKQSLMTAVMTLVQLAGILSANLAVFNLLPLPALDGGRIVFSIIEMIRRKPVDPEKENMVHTIGFILLMVLMVFVLFNDLRRVFG